MLWATKSHYPPFVSYGTEVQAVDFGSREDIFNVTPVTSFRRTRQDNK